MRADTSVADVCEAARRVHEDAHVRAQALRFLGYADEGAADATTRAKVTSALERVSSLARPACVLRTFPTSELPLELPGSSAAEHFAGALELALFCVTLGAEIDRELHLLALTDALSQVIFDAAASAAVERMTDAVEAQIRTDAAARGLFCGWRFSPGYGDLPLAVQGRLLAVLDATRRAGITLTPSKLMVPTKSVSAIVGVHPTPQPGLASSCAVCDLAAFCSLRSRGLSCGTR